MDAQLLEQQVLIAEGTRNGKTDHYPGEDFLWNFASKTRLNIELSFECERAANLLRDSSGALDLDHFTPQGGLIRGARALEQAQSLSQKLHLLLGRRHSRAGSSRRHRPMPADHHRSHIREQEGSLSASATVYAKVRNLGGNCSSI